MSRRYGDWIEAYLKYTENTEPPYLYKLWNAMSAVSGALQRKTSVKLQKGRETFPNLFVALVGNSGAGKSDSMSPIRTIMEDTGINISANRYTTEALIRALKESFVNEPAPNGKPIIHSSLSVHASELINFLGDRDNDKLQVLCDLYDCGRVWQYVTKDKKLSDEVIKPCINIIGGITPDLMKTGLPPTAFGGGLTSRMICVYADKLEKTIPISFETEEDREHHAYLIDDLTDIKSLYGKFKVTQKFLDAWEKWYSNARKQYPFKLKLLESYCSRRTLHILKMSMVICVSEGNDMILHAKHLQRAVDYLKDTEKVMARVFEGVGGSKLSSATSEIMSFLSNRGEVNSSEVHSRFYRDASYAEVEEILTQLNKMNFVNITTAGKITINEKEKENES